MQEAYKIGDIVLATAGRDEKRFFVVISVIDESYVMIADGKSRRSESPKKKKVKHIKLVRKADKESLDMFLKNGRYSNSGLRKIIDEYKKSLEDLETSETSEASGNLNVSGGLE